MKGENEIKYYGDENAEPLGDYGNIMIPEHFVAESKGPVIHSLFDLNVLYDLKKLKEVINDEILSIDNALKKEGYSSTLRELRGDCVSLLHEVDNKIMEIKSLI